MTIVDPIRDEQGWAFHNGRGHSVDPVNGFHFLSEAYRTTDPKYHGRVTVPVLWDTVTRRIVTNSDDDLMRIFNGGFNRFTASSVDLYPAALRPEIDEMNHFLYEQVNDGVYRAGFATSQRVYEEPLGRSSPRWISWMPGFVTVAISLARNSSSPIGGCLSLCSGLMPSITAISNATSGVSSTTRTCPATSKTSTRWPASRRPWISTISSGTTT